MLLKVSMPQFNRQALRRPALMPRARSPIDVNETLGFRLRKPLVEIPVAQPPGVVGLVEVNGGLRLVIRGK